MIFIINKYQNIIKMNIERLQFNSELRLVYKFLDEYKNLPTDELKQTSFLELLEYITTESKHLNYDSMRKTLNIKISDAIKKWPNIGFEQYEFTFSKGNPDVPIANL